MAKTVKPDEVEKAIIKGRLQKKYPQMLSKEWKDKAKHPGLVKELLARTKRRLSKVFKSSEKPKPKKKFKTVRTRTAEKGLKGAGLSQKEIDRLRGKK